MKNSETVKALRAIAAEYKKTHGETLSELETWAFDFSLIKNNKVLSSVVNKATPEPIQVNKYIEKLLNHLIFQSFLVKRGDNYFLTAEGFLKGNENLISQFLSFLNKNPGVISFCALIISLFSLYVSILEP